MLGGACHTGAEVACEGRWVLADASLYPPGILPRDAAGRLLSIDDAAQDPGLLDAVPSYINYETGHVHRFAHDYPRTYAQIERWLRCPLLPSVAYFGADFATDKEPGTVRRLRKRFPIESLRRSPDQGWTDLVEDTALQGPPVSTVQRPEQVSELVCNGDIIHWRPAYHCAGAPVEYHVVVSDRPRGWEYEELAVGTDFATPGRSVITRATKIELPVKSNGPRFVSVTAELISNPGAFHLPSEEFFVG